MGEGKEEKAAFELIRLDLQHFCLVEIANTLVSSDHRSNRRSLQREENVRSLPLDLRHSGDPDSVPSRHSERGFASAGPFAQ